jgi:SsrA-binding protein
MKQIFNRKAGYNYNLLEKLEAGVVLTGNEIKQVRAGKAALNDSYVLIRDGEPFLINAHIATYEKAAEKTTDTRRERKLLLNKKEIDYLIGKLAGSNLTLVPTRLYFKRNYAKIEVALAQGKKKYDKREAIKRKEAKREAQRLLRSDKLRFQEERAHS